MRKSKFILAGALLCAALAYAVKYKVEAVDGSPPGYTIPRKIQYTLVLRNTTGQRVEMAELWTYAPLRETSTQRRVRLATSHPHERLPAGPDNEILHFQFPDLSPYAVKTIDVEAEFLLSDRPNPFSQPDLTPWLEAAPYIESDHAALIQRARALSADNPLKTAENIHNWVADNVKYIGYTRRGRGALYALQYNKGDCTEFMYLFAALGRAAGVPTRCMAGYVQEQSGPLKPAEYHNWAEFYHDGAWRLADPQKRVFMKSGAAYIATRVIQDGDNGPMGNFNRFRYKGAGVEVEMR
ncbi:MAG: transglutaminase domain-containing protein [Desulfobacterales bacterium]|nr:transglutaminase domain-containing protein [Desulfobacterales bacterium]